MNLINMKKYFEEIRAYKNVVLFGCDEKGREAMKLLQEHGIQVAVACDNNEALWGKRFASNMMIQSFEDVISNMGGLLYYYNRHVEKRT